MARIVDKDAKKRGIIEAAAVVFARDGFANAKMADVAEEAGIGKGTVYEYFPSKEDLFLELCRHLVRWPQDKSRFLGDPREGLKTVIVAVLESYEKASSFFTILIDYWSVVVRDKNAKRDLFLAQGEGFYDYPRRLVAEVVRTGQARKVFSRAFTAEKIAQIIIAAIEGLRIQRMLDPRHVDMDADIKLLTHFVMAGLKPGNAARRTPAR
ncbi:MAG: TetR family transcriptional regulator [Alphaproteobacteria bacterium]|nr:TetR family transcriptional regulator [Alphaproteobacteria bacterium]